ncbi:hypothetical protein SEVIR_9G027351v4 [Setaria viridis]
MSGYDSARVIFYRPTHAPTHARGDVDLTTSRSRRGHSAQNSSSPATSLASVSAARHNSSATRRRRPRARPRTSAAVETSPCRAHHRVADVARRPGLTVHRPAR